MKKLQIAFLLAAVALVGAWMGIGSSDGVPVAYGYCYNNSLASASGIASFTDVSPNNPCNGLSAAALAQYRYVVFCAYTANVNWLDSGTPTATVGSGGQQLTAGSCMSYSASNLNGVQFIQQSASAIVGATVYKVP